MRPAALRGWIGPPKGVPAMLTPFHLAYNVTSLNEARAFYGGVLGCREGRST